MNSRMKGVVGFVFSLLLVVTGGNANAAYTYDSDNQGWLQTYVGRPAGGPGYDTLYANTAADWRSNSGNPDGNIYQVSGGATQRAYWMGFSGDNSLGNLAGKYLQTDIFSTNNWRTLANGTYGDDGNVYARWVIANQVATGWNMFISDRNASINVNTLNGWETHSVDLVAANFIRWPNFDAGTQTFDQLLTDYDSIGLYLFSGTDTISNINGGAGTWNASYQLLHYGAYSSDNNRAMWALDNFKAVPEPQTFALMSLLLALLAIQLRLRQR